MGGSVVAGVVLMKVVSVVVEMRRRMSDKRVVFLRIFLVFIGDNFLGVGFCFFGLICVRKMGMRPMM